MLQHALIKHVTICSSRQTAKLQKPSPPPWDRRMLRKTDAFLPTRNRLTTAAAVVVVVTYLALLSSLNAFSLISISAMGSVSSEDDFNPNSKRFESYSLSADVSESESSSALSYDNQPGSSSLTSSPFAGPNSSGNLDFPVQITLPVFGGRHVIIPSDKPEKPLAATSDSSGKV